MNQVAKAMERLRPWLPLRENASFSGAFDAVYSGAHADIVTLWQEALFREQQSDEQKKPLGEERGARPDDTKKWPKTTPTGHTYVEPRTYEALCHEHDNAAQAAIESWEEDECPPEPTWEMVGIAHREVERLQRELRGLKRTVYEFVPHFKLHRDGSVTPQQDDTPVWTMGTMHEGKNEEEPLALTVTEDAVEEVEVTREPSSWRAGGTGVPTSWNLDKLREMRDGALTEWIEVEAIIREVEKREKEEDPVEAKARVEADRRYSGDPNHAFIEGAVWAARHVLGQEQS